MGSRRKQKTEKSMIQNLYWKQVFRSPKTKIGLMVVIIFVLAAIFAPVLAPHDPLLVDVSIKLKNPSAAYPLGTDQLGRCILSRLLWGSRYSLSYSFTVLLITVCVGVPIGLFAGYVGGKIDSIIMRIIDVFMAMPVFIVALAIAGTVGANGAHLILSLSVVSWAEYARLARALTLQEKNKNYMTALKSRRLRPRKDHIQACIEKYPAICDRTGNNGNRFDHSVNCRFFLYRPWCAGTDTGMGDHA